MPTKEVFCDEDVPREVATYLRGRGYTVNLPVENGTAGEPDATHLEMCARQGWVLITQNRRDFRRLHALWATLVLWGVLRERHYGILTNYEQEQETPVRWAQLLDEMLQQDGVELRGQMFLWRKSTLIWERESVAIR